MDHRDHVYLLRKGVPARGGQWADLGAGAGAFTLALAELLGDGGEITAVDKDAGRLRRLAEAMDGQFPSVALRCQVGDFNRPLNLPLLDGMVMANALHFVDQKAPLLNLIRTYLKQDGRLIVVEYDTDRGNRWVPYPLSYTSWRALAHRVGLRHTELLATRPSSFLGSFYATASW